ncbi:MAG: DUF4856 domain-containing protein [Crocinitomicaceae bacterium]
MKNSIIALLTIGLVATSCKKEGCMDQNASNYNHDAQKDNGSCEYKAPSSYMFTDEAGNNTVSFGGQTERLNQLDELIAYAETGETTPISASILSDMFANTGGNGNGNFSFTSTKDLKSKCYSLDTTTIMGYFDSIALASASFASQASNGQAGILTSGTSTYLFSANGIQYSEVIEKTIMGAVFYYQMNSVYLSDSKMNVDNTTAVDPANGEYYTTMEHHFDEAFGYFGVPIDFPSNTNGIRFWGKYCNAVNSAINSNSLLMQAFLEGRYAITQNDMNTRDANRLIIQENMEKLVAANAVRYLDEGLSYFGTDQAKFLHVMSEAWAFVNIIRYSPVNTRKMTPTEVDALVGQFGTNFWNLTLNDLNAIKTTLTTTYNL